MSDKQSWSQEYRQSLERDKGRGMRSNDAHRRAADAADRARFGRPRVTPNSRDLTAKPSRFSLIGLVPTRENEREREIQELVAAGVCEHIGRATRIRTTPLNPPTPPRPAYVRLAVHPLGTAAQ